MDLIKSITQTRFWGKLCYVTLNNDCTCYTKTYTRIKKNDWLPYLKCLHNLAKTVLNVCGQLKKSGQTTIFNYKI